MKYFRSKEHEQKVVVNQMGEFLESLVEPLLLLVPDGIEFDLKPTEARFDRFLRFCRSSCLVCTRTYVGLVVLDPVA